MTQQQKIKINSDAMKQIIKICVTAQLRTHRKGKHPKQNAVSTSFEKNL